MATSLCARKRTKRVAQSDQPCRKESLSRSESPIRRPCLHVLLCWPFLHGLQSDVEDKAKRNTVGAWCSARSEMGVVVRAVRQKSQSINAWHRNGRVRYLGGGRLLAQSGVDKGGRHGAKCYLPDLVERALTEVVFAAPCLGTLSRYFCVGGWPLAGAARLSRKIPFFFPLSFR